MRKNLYFFSTLALLSAFTVLLVSSCQKEASGPGGDPPPSIDGEKVTAGIRGIVVDENNIPVVGANVSSGGKTTTTDRYGIFTFKNISLSKNNGYVRVKKDGFFEGSRSFVSVAGRVHTVRIKLLAKNNAGSFAGATGGTINLTNGAKLVMPAGAVTDASGNAYTGNVNIAMKWLDPTSPELPFIMPGDLRGITTAGEERGLESFGMLGVEMTSSSGQTLKIAAGQTAELTFPIPASIAGNAPATIDLWHFDEVNGRWKQDGQATKNGSNYIAQVAHFSFWNCDAPFPLIDLCMTIVEPTHGMPLNNVQIRIKRPNGSYGYGRTDSLGNLCGKVPQNEALVLEILDQCNNVLASQNIGPFSANTTLGNISINLPAVNTLTISGTIQNCSSANVTNGAAVIYVAGGMTYSAPVTNGNFSIDLLTCGANINFTVLPVDYTALQQGAPYSGTGANGSVNVGTLQACGTSSQQFVEVLIDGVPNNFVSPPDNMMAYDSSAPANSTTIYASGGNGSTTGNRYFNLSFPSAGTTGTFPINSLFMNFSTIGTQQIISANPTVNITGYGPPTTGFVAGNFTVQMDFQGVTKTVSCNFRVRRS